MKPDGRYDKTKARLVRDGSTQVKQWVHEDYTLSPVQAKKFLSVS